MFKGFAGSRPTLRISLFKMRTTSYLYGIKFHLEHHSFEHTTGIQLTHLFKEPRKRKKQKHQQNKAKFNIFYYYRGFDSKFLVNLFMPLRGCGSESLSQDSNCVQITQFNHLRLPSDKLSFVRKISNRFCLRYITCF